MTPPTYDFMLHCIGCFEEHPVVRYTDQVYADHPYICPDCCYERDRQRSLGHPA